MLEERPPTFWGEEGKSRWPPEASRGCSSRKAVREVHARFRIEHPAGARRRIRPDSEREDPNLQPREVEMPLHLVVVRSARLRWRVISFYVQVGRDMLLKYDISLDLPLHSHNNLDLPILPFVYEGHPSCSRRQLERRQQRRGQRSGDTNESIRLGRGGLWTRRAAGGGGTGFRHKGAPRHIPAGAPGKWTWAWSG